MTVFTKHHHSLTCGYPKKVISRVIQRRKTAAATAKPSKQSAKSKSQHSEYRHMAVIPYVRGLSEKLQRIYRRHGISCAQKPANTLRSLLVRPKDPRPKLQTSHCVYKIPCKNCTTPYIGETERHLECRIKEHQASVKKVTNQKFTRARASESADIEHKSALADHAAQDNHVIDWDNASILATQCHNKKGRWIREAIWVRSEDAGTVNRNEGGYELSRTWDALLSTRDRLAGTNQS